MLSIDILNQIEVKKTIKKHLRIKDNEILYIVEEYLKHNNTKRDALKLEFESGEKDYRKINKKKLDNFLDKKLG